MAHWTEALKIVPPEQGERAFEYLDRLRESGRTNMWGAGPYLQLRFPALDEDEIKGLHLGWMETFDGVTPAGGRFEKALQIKEKPDG